MKPRHNQLGMYIDLLERVSRREIRDSRRLQADERRALFNDLTDAVRRAAHP